MLQSLPDHPGSPSGASFGCDACATIQPLDLLCHVTHTRDTLLCLRCCHCSEHRLDADPGGRVVWTEQHGWRGLHDSLWRTRRHS